MVTLVADPRDVRYVQRETLVGAGVSLSPEFERALWPLSPEHGEPMEKIVTGGVQAGKSTEAAAEVYTELPGMDMDRSLPNGERDPYRFWYIMPSYETPKTELEYLISWCRGYYGSDSVTDSMPNGGAAELVLFNGRAIVETRSSRNPEAIASRACDKVVVCEAGQQPGSVRDAALERTITRRAPVTYTGTLEDDEAKPRFAWYDTLAQRWEDDWSEGVAVSLPTWANLAKFPQGANEPFLLDRKARLPDYVFERRYGGKARGVQYPVYPEFLVGDDAQWDYPGITNTECILSLSAGGYDYGTTPGHPSALVAVTVTPNDVAVVRDAWWITPGGDTKRNDIQRDLFSHDYGIRKNRWMFDPMLDESADRAGATASASRRLARVGKVTARLTDGRLKFDLSNEGARAVLAQMKRIHYIKRESASQGTYYEYHRADDDLGAAFEMAIDMIDGGGGSIPNTVGNAVGGFTGRRQAKSAYQKLRV